MSSCGGGYGFGPKGIVYSAKEHQDVHETLCGLCEKNEGSNLWPTDLSHVVHIECLTLIKPYAELIEAKLNASFPSKIQHINKQKAQSEAFSALRPHLNKKPVTIFCSENPLAFKELIEKVALTAIDELKPK